MALLVEPEAESATPSGTGAGGASARTWVRGLRAASTAVVLGAGVAGLRHAGLLEGSVALGAAVVAVLAVPTSRNLSRRIVLAGCMFFGWVPLMWWVSLPVGSVGRATILLSGTIALTGAWVAAGERPLERLRRLVPAWRWVDLLPPLAAAAAALVLASWLSVRNGAAALTLLLKGWDNAAHANVVTMIRVHGSTMATLGPPPDGTSWSYSNYPQGFHACAATLIELMSSPAVGTPAQEVTRYMIATAVINVAIVAMLTAGICALAPIRRRFFVALPAVLLVFALISLGPGAASLGNGFTNFVLAAALVGACALVAISMPRVAMPLQTAALGGALVGVAHNWAPLLVMAVPAAAVVLLPVRRRRWSADRVRWAFTVLVVGFTAVGVGLAFLQLSSVKTAALATVGGAIDPAPLGQTLAVALTAIAACLIVVRLREVGTRGAGPGSMLSRVDQRLASLAVVPAFGLGLMGVLALQDHAAGGPPGYYLLKFATAVEIVSVIVLTAALVTIVARVMPAASQRGGRAAAVAASLLLGLGATQVFGLAAPWPNSPIILAPGVGLWHTTRTALAAPSPTAQDLLASTSVQFRYPGTAVVYLAVSPDDSVEPRLANAWYRALTGTWTAGSIAIPSGNRPIRGAAGAAATAATILHAHPEALIVVRPDLRDAVRSLVPNAAMRTRIVTW